MRNLGSERRGLLGRLHNPVQTRWSPHPAMGWGGVGSLQVRAGARAFLLMWTREGRGKPVGGLSAWSGGSRGRKPAFGLNPGSPYPCEFPSPFCWLHSVSQGGAGELRAGRRLRLVLAPAPPSLDDQGQVRELDLLTCQWRMVTVVPGEFSAWPRARASSPLSVPKLVFVIY